MTASTHTTQIIARIMGATTETILWGPARDWVQAHARQSELKCRVGSGQATYHRFDPQTRRHTITYGKLMVAAKFSAQTSQGWLSTREIQGRGYFGGEVTTANLLAHTCCHEFAHLLQSVSGERHYGSVHNPAFYRILDEMHDSGGADAIRHLLLSRCEERGIALPQTAMNLEEANRRIEEFAVGDSVCFGNAQRQREGKIVRINRRTCTVQGTGRWRGARYRVPVSLMSHR